jgi:DNA topoisomerase-1
MSKLIIVESPTKAKKIQAMLGSGWVVKASVGHVRDLPKGNNLNVSRPAYELTYEISKGKEDVVSGLRAAAKAADEVFLATDPDREGEAIGWHLEQILGLKNPPRLEYHEITEPAIKKSIANARRLDRAMISAQAARRAIDRIIGWDGSGAVRSRTACSSVGRVQTVGVRYIVEREEAIRNFASRGHFGALLMLSTPDASKPWTAAWDIKPHLPPNEKLLTDEAFAKKVTAIRDVRVVSCEESVSKERPPAAFTTPALQREANKRFKMKSKDTDAICQELFQDGHITYHRTDTPNISDEAFDALTEYARANNLPVRGKKLVTASKESAQEAHEAIRPTHFEVENCGLGDRAQKIYNLIRLRTLASQMSDAEYDVRVVVLESAVPIDGKPVRFNGRGRTLKVPGWRTVFDSVEEDEANNPVPALADGKTIKADDCKLQIKKTEPPNRYTEATLNKALEDDGVGRPSTYSKIIEVIQDREYVVVRAEKKNDYFHPTELGFQLIEAVRGHFAFGEIQYTAAMEEHLDGIAKGKEDYVAVMQMLDGQLQSEIGTFAKAELSGGVKCPKCMTGDLLERTRKDGKGKFFSCNRYKKDDAASCNAIFNSINGAPDLTARVTGGKCPTCNAGDLIERTRKDGKGKFFSCSAYKKNDAASCKAIFDSVNGTPDFTPRAEKVSGGACPDCGKTVYRHEFSGRAFWGCSGYKKDDPKSCSGSWKDLDGKPDFAGAQNTGDCPKCKVGKRCVGPARTEPDSSILATSGRKTTRKAARRFSKTSTVSLILKRRKSKKARHARSVKRAT